MFDITIVLNVHREITYLRRTLLSLVEAVTFAHNDGLSCELVIVLDNSDEHTRTWIKAEDLSAFQATQIIEVDNRSLGLSRNSGIAIAKGQYITTCDADDLISYNMLSACYRTAQAHTSDIAVFPEFLLAFGANTHLCRYYGSKDISTLSLFSDHPYISRIFFSSDIARRHPYKHADHSQGYAYEDWCLNAELIANGIEFVIAPETTLYYRQRQGSLLTQANLDSARLTLPNKFLQPSIYTEVNKEAAQSAMKALWSTPTQASIHKDFFGNAANHRTAQAANLIDPAILFHSDLNVTYTNKGISPAAGLAYYKACQLLSQTDYTDVILLPYLIAGGAEKYILNFINALKDIGVGKRFLFLCGEPVNRHMWLENLPDNSDFIDLYALCKGDEAAIDLITIRLIQFAGDSPRVHVKSSAYTHRFLRRFCKILKPNRVIYYRFPDAVDKSVQLTYGATFNILSDHIDQIDDVISDHEALVAHDRLRFGVLSSRWHCLYTQCDLPEKIWQPPTNSAKKKLLWASRVDPQKRPEMLIKLLEKLRSRCPYIHIDIYGHFSSHYDTSLFNGISNASYKGGFNQFNDLPLVDYTAFLYTSDFDGMPNVLLEALAAGMPVIAPSIGGIPEAIQHQRTGWLLKTSGDDIDDAEVYARCLETFDFDPDKLSRIGQAARASVETRHAHAIFLNNVRKLIGLDAPPPNLPNKPLTPKQKLATVLRQLSEKEQALQQERARSIKLSLQLHHMDHTVPVVFAPDAAVHKPSGQPDLRVVELEQQLRAAQDQLNNSRVLKVARYFGRLIGYQGRRTYR
ncbi:glycosyltransferase [Asticcacaulis tiandongensis]|uniref:glycosyltransferase n=1 Tax=Asticcacaulis tiandongensis TaxID=2565365 RepID=UPI00112AC841|nr:glycosyltransferase [Asticcacaulis tiandongensis]